MLCLCEPRLAVQMKQNKQAGAIWSWLLPKHETPADQSKTTYSVLGVWSHSRRWTQSGRRATRWRCRKNGSYVSLRSSQPRGSDGRISLKDSDRLTFKNVKKQTNSRALSCIKVRSLQLCEASFYYLWVVNVSVAVCSQLTHTVVTQAAVGGARRAEHLAGEAVLELHHLLID